MESALSAVPEGPVAIGAPAALLERAQHGDRVAFAELYLELFDPIYRHLYRALGNRDDAQEAAQDVFVKALGAIKRFENRGASLRAWIFQIARNHAIDHARKHRRVRVTDPVEVAERQETAALRIPGSGGGHVLGGGLAEVIAELPRTQQRVLALRYVSDMTPAEIGDTLGVSADSVRHMQHRALKTLANALAA
jgi:RNA polymerase sigma-70 factor, ECF subfamily